MKFKYIERALVTVFLLVYIYSLLNTAIPAWQGLDPLINIAKQGGLKFNYTLNCFLPDLLIVLAVYLSCIWMATGLPDHYIGRRDWKHALLASLAGFLIALLMIHTVASLPFVVFTMSISAITTLITF